MKVIPQSHEGLSHTTVLVFETEAYLVPLSNVIDDIILAYKFVGNVSNVVVQGCDNLVMADQIGVSTVTIHGAHLKMQGHSSPVRKHRSGRSEPRRGPNHLGPQIVQDLQEREAFGVATMLRE